MAKRKKSMIALKRECFRAWGQAILSRDRECVTCEAPSRHPHHLFPKSRYRHLWFDLRNGVGLCVSCHYRMHYDPIVPVLYLQAKLAGKFEGLVNEASFGRRKNPYKRHELENILVALKGAECELSSSPKTANRKVTLF